MTVRREGSKHFCTSSTLLRRLMCSWLHAGQVVRCRLEQIINCIVMASTQGGWHWDFIDAMQFLFLKYSHHPLSACHFNSCIHLFPAAADTALAPDFLHARDLPSLLHPCCNNYGNNTFTPMQLSISDQRTIANIMDDTQRWLHSVDGIVIATHLVSMQDNAICSTMYSSYVLCMLLSHAFYT